MTGASPRLAVSAANRLTTEALVSGLRPLGLDVVCAEHDPGRLIPALRGAEPVDVVVMSVRAVLSDHHRGGVHHLGAPVLAVGDGSEEELEQTMRVGVAAYIAWSQPLVAMADAARRVAAGESLVPPGMLGGLLRRLIERSRFADEVLMRLTRLSSREREVLGLLCDGLGPAAIADRLVVSPQTVRSHTAAVLTKLEVHSRVEAVGLIHDHGLRPVLDAMEVTA